MFVNRRRNLTPTSKGTGAKLGVPVRAGYFRSCSWTGGGAWSGF
jgi:hypothetical protein